MVWLAVAVYVALAGYILWQAYLLDTYRKMYEANKPPF